MTKEELKKCKNNIVYLDGLHPFNIKSYWVIRTLEKEPRYVETVAYWNGTTDYSLVYNVNYGKVYYSVNPPYRTAEKFKEITGIEYCFQEVDEKAYKHYKDYEKYYNGLRKLTEEEKKQLQKEREEYKQKIHPLENKRF